jgi:endoglucanase
MKTPRLIIRLLLLLSFLVSPLLFSTTFFSPFLISCKASFFEDTTDTTADTNTDPDTNGTGTGSSAGGVTTISDTTKFAVQDGKIYHRGTEIRMFGINWFGFETNNYTVHGLWARNYQEIIDHMKSLRFNAVRLPFCPDILEAVTPNSINYAVNQDLTGLNSLELFDKIIEAFNAAEIYILLDHHRPDCNAISELWYVNGYTEQDWINDLTFIANRYKNTEYFMGVDLKNEPHGAATWGTGNSLTDWNTAAERAAAAILALNDEILIFVEGIQSNGYCSSATDHWWGGNLEPMNCAPLNIDSSRLVLSPHVYGPDVFNQSYFNVSNFPSNMPAIWETHFGFLTEDYPVVFGEFGGKYGDGDPKDITWQDAMVDYMIEKNMCSFFYWCLNPNSGDTYGILDEQTWSVVENPAKLDNIHRLIDHCSQ